MKLGFLGFKLPRRATLRPLAFISLLAASILGLLLWQLRELVSASEWVDHSDQVIAEIHQTEKLVLDLETGFRGYMLVHDKEFLAPFNEGRKAIGPTLEHLRGLTRDNPAQQQRLDALLPRLEAWFAFGDRALAVEEQGGDPQTLIRTRRGKDQVDAMRGILRDMVASEVTLRDARSLQARHRAELAALSSTIAGLALGALLLINSIRRRRWEAKLAQSEARFRALAEQVREYAIFTLDPTGHIATWNAGAERLKGYRADEILGKHFSIFYPPEELASGKPTLELAEALSKGQVEDEGWRVRKDGSRFWANVLITRLADEEGKTIGFAKVTRDLTSRRQAEQALRESEERFRLAMDEAPIGMALVGLDGRFLRVNRALCSIVQYNPDELMGRTFQSITHPEDLDIDLELAGKLARGEISHYQLGKRYIRKDGQVVDIMLSGSAVRDDTGAPLYFVAQIQDITETKRAEVALRKSEARFRELIEQASEGIFIADLDGRYIDVNGAACELLGFRRDELIGKTIADILPPEDLPRLVAAREILLEPGTIQIAEWRLRRKSGEYVDVEVSAKILPDGRWQAFVRDIREHKRAREALLRSEERLLRAQRIGSVGSWEWNLKTGETHYSEEAIRLFEMAAEGAASEPFDMLENVHPVDREKVVRMARRVSASGLPGSLEVRVLTRDQGERILALRAEARQVNGQTVEVDGTALDITQRKRAEQETQEALRRFRTIFEETPVGIVLVHGERGERIEANSHAEALFGASLKSEGGVAQYAPSIHTMDGQPIPMADLPSLRALNGERIEGMEAVLHNPQRGKVPILLNAAPIPATEFGFPEAIVAFEDITALKELDRLRAEWNSLIAHDLRQPLNAISTAVQVIARKGIPEDARRPLEMVRTGVRRLNRMIEDLLDYSRLEARQLKLSRSLVDLRGIVKESVERMAPEQPDRRFEFEDGPDRAVVEADPDRIAQVLDNLLTNAVKYGDPGTPIRVELSCEEGNACVAVTNHGTEIPQDELPHLFERFRRAKVQRSGVRGVGLGLYITRELVEAHGGNIEASSSQHRTTFRFRLPLAEAEGEEPAPAPAG